MRTAAVLLAAALLAAAPALARVPDPSPALHTDFDHYTLALTWQPGFCAEHSCLPDTPRAPLIGLHGLWASLPRTLADRGVDNPQWWAKGCDLLQHGDAAPALPVAVRRALDRTMPHTGHDLLRHEFDKHVQCFGFDPALFFRTELAMRDAVSDTAFARALQAMAGQGATRDALLASFADSFHTDHPRALQLQCHTDRDGAVVLSQLWITVRHDRVAAFPAPASLTDSPVPQDNCPAGFTVPAWGP